MIPRDACRGCRNDYYNLPGNALDGKRCWSAGSGKMMTRYAISIHTVPTQPFAFQKVKRPSCYWQTGTSHYNELPNFVKLDQVVGHARARKAAAAK